MIAILKDLLLMEKEIKQGNDNNLIYVFTCYQKGNKVLIQIKDIPFEMYTNTAEGTTLDLECKLISWSQGGKTGISVKYLGVGEVGREPRATK